jgi:hypothetical protein
MAAVGAHHPLAPHGRVVAILFVAIVPFMMPPFL